MGYVASQMICPRSPSFLIDILPTDPECCDGSDEWDSWVQCPDRCAEIGKKYRDALAAETKMRKTVSLASDGDVLPADC
jgi:hypothetical protein